VSHANLRSQVVAILHKVLSKPGKVKYGNVHLLAILLSALYRYHNEFVLSVIDTLLESICFGLENNDFQFNQRRIAEVKFLGELYNYRMLEHPVVFETMYKIMTFGWGMNEITLFCFIQRVVAADSIFRRTSNTGSRQSIRSSR
jgi:hypothetical protein